MDIGVITPNFSFKRRKRSCKLDVQQAEPPTYVVLCTSEVLRLLTPALYPVKYKHRLWHLSHI